jgi:UDP-N-acetylglucosamine transferase subunit ALG13
MILVATGASQFPFDRLLRAVDALPDGERIVVQHGCSTVKPARGECLDFLPMPELAALVREARAVVTHAGVGSILLCLTNGRSPLVVPRLKRFGETVDDHQLESARRFAEAGLVTLVEDPAELASALANAGDRVVAPPAREGQLVRELRTYFAETIEPRSAVRT